MSKIVRTDEHRDYTVHFLREGRHYLGYSITDKETNAVVASGFGFVDTSNYIEHAVIIRLRSLRGEPPLNWVCNDNGLRAVAA